MTITDEQKQDTLSDKEINNRSSSVMVIGSTSQKHSKDETKIDSVKLQ